MLVAPVETIPAGVLNWWFIHDCTCGCLVGVEALDNRCMGTAVARRISSPVIEVGTKYLAVSNYFVAGDRGRNKISCCFKLSENTLCPPGLMSYLTRLASRFMSDHSYSFVVFFLLLLARPTGFSNLGLFFYPYGRFSNNPIFSTFG